MEWGFLALFAAAMYFSDQRGQSWPGWLFAGAVLAALPILVWRCPDEWRQLPNRPTFVVLLTAWIALFSIWGNPTFGYLDSPSLFAWMFDIYTSPLNDEEHGLLIPFVVLAIFWWKRRELVAKPTEFWPPAAFLVLLALLLHLVGYLIQQQRLSVMAFMLGLYALTGLVWGRNWLRASFFPYFLFLFCMPVGELAAQLTLPLREMVAAIVAAIGHLGIAPDVMRDGTQLFDAQHTFAYEVAPACSGIRSIVALLAITTCYGFLCLRHNALRVLMMLTAIPLAILGNVVRLTLTVIVAEMFGQAAGKAVETKLGFVTFGLAIVCTLSLGRWLELKEGKSSVEPATPPPTNPPAPITP